MLFWNPYVLTSKIQAAFKWFWLHSTEWTWTAASSYFLKIYTEFSLPDTQQTGFDVNRIDVNEELRKGLTKAPRDVDADLKRHIPLLSGMRK